MIKKFFRIRDKIDSLERIRKLYIILLVCSLAFLLVAMNYFYISTLRDVEVLYAQYTKDRIIDIKKSFLKDSINNIINGIEQTQTETKTLCTNRLESF
ncbi:hypothetical protein KQI42_12515 [Tissierella sp. MSJ-40]|uniref:Uncharacterized protein n=1 Tax=Tissierella simiarum TaxID=2841534 RepID=A0ABS6E7E9_9FIRM|nr:hypothetical protein [Tissierella simiarum]MBU5438842.1 hypothetical protein [Tissierella simiarum]